MFERNVGGLDRLGRAVGAVVLTLLAVRALSGGRRRTALLSVLGALALGFNATTQFCGLNRTLGIDTTAEE